MNETGNPLLARYEQQIATVEERLEMMRDGRLAVREKTLENPAWVDVTEKAIAQDEQMLRTIREVTERLQERKDGIEG